MSTAGKVYKCRVKSRRTGFQLEIVGAPALTASGRTIEAAAEVLRELICDKHGGAEVFLQFEPPLAGPAERGPRLPWHVLECNKIVRWKDEFRKELWTDGFCPRCLRGLGKRTAVVRCVDETPKGDFAGLYTDRNGCRLVSPRLVELLRPHARGLDVREVQLPRGSRKKIYELVPHAVESFVLSRKLSPPRGWRCPHCELYYAPQDWPDSPGGAAFFLPVKSGKKTDSLVKWAGSGVTIRLLVAESLLALPDFKRLEGLIKIPVYGLAPPEQAKLQLKRLRRFEG